MLNRRYLRIKAMQAIYACIQSGNQRVDLIEKQMLHSIETLYELFIFQMSVISELVNFETIRIVDAGQKYFPSAEELNPNKKFISNRLIAQLTQNKDLIRKINYYHISWVGEYDIIHNIYTKLKDSRLYKDYMNSGISGYQEDKEFVSRIFKKFISESEALQSFFEEKNIFWSDDYYVAAYMAQKTLGTFSESDDENKTIPGLYKISQGGDNEDKEFVVDLFRKTLLNLKEFDDLILKYVRNWEMERIAMLDNILMNMAITEILNFRSVPVKVSLNEYIDIAKEYSTPQSSIFINGILDSIVKELKEEKRIIKAGRGLIE